MPTSTPVSSEGSFLPDPTAFLPQRAGRLFQVPSELLAHSSDGVTLCSPSSLGRSRCRVLQVSSALLTRLLAPAHGAVSHGLSGPASKPEELSRCSGSCGGAVGLTLLCKVIELKPVNHFGAAWLLLCAWVQRPGVAWSTRGGSLGCSFWRVISPLSCCSQIWVIRFDLNMSEDWNSQGGKGTIMQALSQCDSGPVSKALSSLLVSWESRGRFSSSPDTGALVLER